MCCSNDNDVVAGVVLGVILTAFIMIFVVLMYGEHKVNKYKRYTHCVTHKEASKQVCKDLYQ